MTDTGKVDRRRQVTLVLCAMALLGVTSGIIETTFNNFLSDTFHLTAEQRGRLEFPRELPGFLTALFSGALFFLVETHTAALASLGIAAGVLGLALRGDHYPSMIAFIVLLNSGTHLMMPIQNSITLTLAEEGKAATLLGRLGAASTAATIIGCGFVWASVDYFHLGYRMMFAVAAAVAVAAALFFAAMRLRAAGARRAPFLFRRRYSLFYLLSILFGARKQVFITFGPWVLIKVFHQRPDIFAQLWIVSAVIGVLMRPALGRWIDAYGERPVLMIDALLTIFVCLGYGCAQRLGLGEYALYLVCACFVMDQVLFATGMARATYLNKIAEKREHLAPTLSLGVSLDHAVSMTVPALGGLLWERCGYPAVFYAAATVALVNGIMASRIRTEAPAG